MVGGSIRRGHGPDNSLLSGNTANLGAGVYDDNESDAILQATSSAIVDNTASGAANAGGGIYLVGNTSNRIDFPAVTVAGNVSATGAGFAIDSTGGQSGGGTLANSTVAGNMNAGGVEQDCADAGHAAAGAPDRLGRRQRGRRLHLRLPHHLGPPGRQRSRATG